MIVLNICKNLCRSRLRHCGGSIVHMNNILDKHLVDKGECKKTGITERIIFPSCKSYSTGTHSEGEALLPPLCDFPKAIWPTVFKTLRKSYLIKFVVQNSFDTSFDETEFIEATREALYVLSRALALQDYESLEELVTSNTLSALKTKINTLSDRQRNMLHVHDGDIFLSFIHDVNISYTMENDVQRRFLEIMVVHHYVRGLKKLVGDENMLSKLAMNEDKMVVANQRFQREFTEGVDAPWIVNMINYFSI